MLLMPSCVKYVQLSNSAFQKAPINFIIAVHVFQRASRRTYFREICYCGLARIFVEKIKVTPKVD